MNEYWFLLINWYILMAYWFYSHNRNMGSWWTGVIMASLWWIVAIMWCFGHYFVWREDRDMEIIMRRYNEDNRLVE